MKKLIKNRAQCLDCLDIIESKYRHDFVTCKCYSSEKRTGIFIDGGLCYGRSGAYDFNKFKDLSEWEGEDDPTPKILPGVVKEMGDEWVLVDDGLLPKTGELVVIYDPSDKEAPYVVAIYNEKMKKWRCAHCKKGNLKPKMWKPMKEAV